MTAAVVQGAWMGFLTFVVGHEGLFFGVSLAMCTGFVVLKKKVCVDGSCMMSCVASRCVNGFTVWVPSSGGKSACSSNGGGEKAVPSAVPSANLSARTVAVLTTPHVHGELLLCFRLRCEVLVCSV